MQKSLPGGRMCMPIHVLVPVFFLVICFSAYAQDVGRANLLLFFEQLDLKRKNPAAL